MIDALVRPTLTLEHWRMPACGERCRVFLVTTVGRGYPEQLVSHDPFHHEAYGQHVLARGSAMLDGKIVQTGALALDGLSISATVHGRRVRLTPLETDILFYLAANLDRVCRHGEVLRAVWGPEYAPGFSRSGAARIPVETHLLRVNVARLRRKLGSASALLETNVGIGYRLVDEPPIDPEVQAP